MIHQRDRIRKDRWLPEEDDILRQTAGTVPIHILEKTFNDLADKRLGEGRQRRTLSAIRKRAKDTLKISLKYTLDCWTPNFLAENIFGLNRTTIHSWIRYGRLKTVRMKCNSLKNKVIIRPDLELFFRQYPSYIKSSYPDYNKLERWVDDDLILLVRQAKILTRRGKKGKFQIRFDYGPHKGEIYPSILKAHHATKIGYQTLCNQAHDPNCKYVTILN